jgi:hypothetical protein
MSEHSGSEPSVRQTAVVRLPATLDEANEYFRERGWRLQFRHEDGAIWADLVFVASGSVVARYGGGPHASTEEQAACAAAHRYIVEQEPPPPLPRRLP